MAFVVVVVIAASGFHLHHSLSAYMLRCIPCAQGLSRHIIVSIRGVKKALLSIRVSGVPAVGGVGLRCSHSYSHSHSHSYSHSHLKRSSSFRSLRSLCVSSASSSSHFQIFSLVFVPKMGQALKSSSAAALSALRSTRKSGDTAGTSGHDSGEERVVRVSGEVSSIRCDR